MPVQMTGLLPYNYICNEHRDNRRFSLQAAVVLKPKLLTYLCLHLCCHGAKVHWRHGEARRLLAVCLMQVPNPFPASDRSTALTLWAGFAPSYTAATFYD